MQDKFSPHYLVCPFLKQIVYAIMNYTYRTKLDDISFQIKAEKDWGVDNV